METIKSYTDLEQSKKLAEILPFESADMSWVSCDNGNEKYFRAENRRIILNYEKKHWIPCWSLAALLSVLPNGTNISTPDPLNKVRYSCWNDYDITYASNPVDACYEMILKLHELNLL